jgi:hypothetical protein
LTTKRRGAQHAYWNCAGEIAHEFLSSRAADDIYHYEFFAVWHAAKLSFLTRIAATCMSLKVTASCWTGSQCRFLGGLSIGLANWRRDGDGSAQAMLAEMDDRRQRPYDLASAM